MKASSLSVSDFPARTRQRIHGLAKMFRSIGLIPAREYKFPMRAYWFGESVLFNRSLLDQKQQIAKLLVGLPIINRLAYSMGQGRSLIMAGHLATTVGSLRSPPS